MDSPTTLALYGLGAAAAVTSLVKLKARLELSRAKHRSLTGHARPFTSIWSSSAIRVLPVCLEPAAERLRDRAAAYGAACTIRRSPERLEILDDAISRVQARTRCPASAARVAYWSSQPAEAGAGFPGALFDFC